MSTIQAHGHDMPESDPAKPASLDYAQGVRDALNDVAAGLKEHGNVDPEDIYQLRLRYGVIEKPNVRAFLDIVDRVCRDDLSDYYGDVRQRIRTEVSARFGVS